MAAPASRRSFLSGLASLPLVGGSVALIGSPTAVAAPVSQDLLFAYNEWLFYERRILCKLAWPYYADAESMVPCGHAKDFHFPAGTSWRDVPAPQTRAALVLSAVGCEWLEGGR